MKKLSLSLIALGMIFLSSCNKENVAESAANNNNPTTNTRASLPDDMIFEEKSAEFAAVFAEAAKENTEFFVVDANKPIAITTFKGSYLNLPADALVDERGEMIRGNVVIAFNLITDRGGMIGQDRGTSALTRKGGELAAIESGAEVFIEIKQDGREVFLKEPMDVKIATNEPLDDMQLFVEAEGTGDDLVWVLDEDREVVVRENKNEGGEGGRGDYVYGYQILPDLGNQWQGCNIDRFVDWTCPDRTTVNVEVPAGYDPTNTEVYMIPVGGTNMVANFDYWDPATNTFAEHGGQICVGQDVHFVLVTNNGGGLAYEIHTVTILPGGHLEVFTAPFTPTSMSVLVGIINALP